MYRQELGNLAKGPKRKTCTLKKEKSLNKYIDLRLKYLFVH